MNYASTRKPGGVLAKTQVPCESSEQKALVAWWRLAQPTGRHSLLMAIPNGGRRDAITGARLKAEGVVAGVPDLFLAIPRGAFHGLWLELKKREGGRLSSSQKTMLALLASQGYAVCVCTGWEEAKKAIERYLEGSANAHIA